MNILLIGNGFDLAHGLPTRYVDFINFIKFTHDVKEYYPERSMLELGTESNLNEKLIKFLSRNSINLIDSISEIIYLTHDNGWSEHLEEKVENNKGWIDFESEISNMIKCLDNYKRGYNNNFEQPRVIAINFLNKFGYDVALNPIGRNKNFIIDKYVINDINKHLNNLIKALEIYLENFVQKLEVEYISPDITEMGLIEGVLTFNYTNTYQKRYDGTPEYDYIHGKVNLGNESNNMVLGIDEYLDGYEKDVQLDFIQFKKYFQRIYKKTGCKYKEWIERMKSLSPDIEFEYANNNIYIFGHSLDISDGDILRELILTNIIRITIFYYNDEVYSQQISNIVKIIGQEELIKRVHGSNPNIIFKKQQDMIYIKKD